MITRMPCARRFPCKISGPIRRAVRGGHVDFVLDAELLQRFARLAHDLEVRVAAHHNRNQWLAHFFNRP